MNLKNLRNSGLVVLAVIVVMAVSNCSNSNPTNSWMPSDHKTNGGAVYAAAGDPGRGDQWTYKFAGYVSKIDEVNSVLVFEKEDMLVIITEGTLARLLPESLEAEFSFADLRVGKLVSVYGDMDENHNLVAKIIEFERDKPKPEAIDIQS